MSIAQGSAAPDFELQASGNRTVSLADLKGRPFVLYFYPRADTPGCTKEAQGFQEELETLSAGTLDVVGVSKDAMKSIDKFAEKYGLKFPLASDPDGTVVEAYGAWVEKSMYGKSYMGIDRSTVLVDKDGKVARIWRKVKVPGHAAEVLAAARTLG